MRELVNDKIKILSNQALEMGINFVIINDYDELTNYLQNIPFDELDTGIDTFCAIDTEIKQLDPILFKALVTMDRSYFIPDENMDLYKNILSIGRCKVGITLAEFCIAETASLVIPNTWTFARIISLLPQVHVAVMKYDNILGSFDEFLQILRNTNRIGDGFTIITGPSKTADIELNLVKGVHGPKEVYIIYI